MRFTPDHCPECGEQAHGTLERLSGTARLVFNETGEASYEGSTDVHYDDQETVIGDNGQVTLLCSRGHEWQASMVLKVNKPSDFAAGAAAGTSAHLWIDDRPELAPAPNLAAWYGVVDEAAGGYVAFFQHRTAAERFVAEAAPRFAFWDRARQELAGRRLYDSRELAESEPDTEHLTTVEVRPVDGEQWWPGEDGKPGR